MTIEVLYAFALDEHDQVCSADDAPAGCKYRCLDHGCPMTLRRGEINQAHFAHRPDCGGECSVESSEHKASKLRLVHALADDTKRPVVVRRCRVCDIESSSNPSDVVIPGARGVTEYALAARRIDVAVLAGVTPLLFIESFFSHAVDDSKGEELRRTGVPWIEVRSHDTAKDPYRLVPIRGSHPACRFVCQNCIARSEAARKQLDAFRVVNTRKLGSSLDSHFLRFVQEPKPKPSSKSETWILVPHNEQLPAPPELKRSLRKTGIEITVLSDGALLVHSYTPLDAELRLSLRKYTVSIASMETR